MSFKQHLNLNIEFTKEGGITVVDFSDYRFYSIKLIENVGGKTNYLYTFPSDSGDYYQITSEVDIYTSMMQVFLKDGLIWAQPLY